LHIFVDYLPAINQVGKLWVMER